MRLSPQTSLIILGVLAIASVSIALFYKMATARYDRQQQEILRNDARMLKVQGDQYLGEGNYKAARDAYTQALVTLREMEVPELTLKKTLEGLMETDEVKHLALGEVKFRDRWMTLEDKETLEMTERGLVRFEGKWLPPEEVEKIEEERKDLVEFEGRWIKLEEREGILFERVRKEIEADEAYLERFRKGAEKVVTQMLQYARDFAPSEAVEFYAYVTPEDLKRWSFPKVVRDFRVGKVNVDVDKSYNWPKVWVAAPEDSEGAEGELRRFPLSGRYYVKKVPPSVKISLAYARVKTYLEIGSVIGPQRVIWYFKVREVLGLFPRDSTGDRWYVVESWSSEVQE